MQKANRVRVKTYRAENGKWYVEVTDSMSECFKKGEQLDAADTIDHAIFLRKNKCDMGFSSRSRARAYLKAYINDVGDMFTITGGLH